MNPKIVEEQENDSYVGKQLNLRLFEKVQCIEVKRKKEQKQQAKKSKPKGKGQNKDQLTTDAIGSTNKRSRGPQSLVDEERAIHEAYQVLLTEYHKRRAKRKKQTRQAQKKQETRNEEKEIIEDDFAHLRRKQLTE